MSITRRKGNGRQDNSNDEPKQLMCGRRKIIYDKNIPANYINTFLLQVHDANKKQNDDLLFTSTPNGLILLSLPVSQPTQEQAAPNAVGSIEIGNRRIDYPQNVEPLELFVFLKQEVESQLNRFDAQPRAMRTTSGFSMFSTINDSYDSRNEAELQYSISKKL